MALINIAGKSYEVVLENKAGFNLEAFRSRYSEVLERYDYIVGDWGYNQLRLKGFFKDGSSKATKDTTFAFATDYLNEYCNFGCAYFILEKKFDHSGQSEEEADSLLADLDDDFDLPEVYTSSATKQQLQGSSNVSGADEMEEVVPVKGANAHRNAQDKQPQQAKGQEKPQRRRPFKPRQNKNHDKAQQQNQRGGGNGQQQANPNKAADGGKEQNPAKKNKKRPQKSFRHFDRKKNKEQAPVGQE